MRAVSAFRGIRQVKGRLALGAMLFIGAAAAHAQSDPNFRFISACKLIQFGSEGSGGGTQWEKTGLDTATVGNVIATRMLTLSTTSLTAAKANGLDPKALQGARWVGTPPMAGHIIPTNVKGLGIRISSTRNAGVYVKPQNADYFLTIFSVDLRTGSAAGWWSFGGVILVELVVTGPIAPGMHVVEDIDPVWSETQFEVVAIQRIKAEAPALGTIMESNSFDGSSGPGESAKCNHRARYRVIDILTFGGGGVPIEATCTVDSKFTGAGFSLPMGNYAPSDFPRNGDVSKEIPFEVSVHTCGPGAKPRIGFNAQYGLIPGAGNVLQLKDHAVVTSAKNLGVILTRQGGSAQNPLDVGQGGQVGTKYEFDNVPGGGVGANGGAEIKLSARYQRVDQVESGVKGGVADSQVNFNIYYD